MQDEFHERIGQLDYEDIISLYIEHKTVELNNVIEGFESSFFTIALPDPDSLEDYTLIYVGNQKKIKGLTFRSGRSLKNRDFYTLRFAKAIEDEFPKVNSLVIFTTFQNNIKRVFENFGILCLPDFIAELGENFSILLTGNNKHSVDRILQVDIIEIYRSFFHRTKTTQDQNRLQKIYLMYDQKEGLIKIGETKTKLITRMKGIAEPTLRGKDPMIEVITAWEAPKDLEIQLHTRYHHKRVRGEWFDLRASDLKEINEITQNFNLIALDTIK